MSNDICSICLENFKKPITHQCGHTFCIDCFDELIKRRPDNTAIKCPLCRQDIPSTEKRFILLPNTEEKEKEKEERINRLASIFVYAFLINSLLIIFLFKYLINPLLYYTKYTCHK